VEIFSWKPDEASVVSERGLIESSVPFGDGYRQVIYKGIARSWKVIFRTQNDHELRAINDLGRSAKPFLWVQPSPHDSDGEHVTRGNLLHSSETNGRMTQLEFAFHVEVVGVEFAEEARQKYGARDTGRNRG
jgi:phage-related protein